jgi:uncharacterized protein YukE
MMAGLAGTVLGLAGTIASLKIPAPGSDTIDKLTEILSSVLPHMQTAFAATLWGLLAALLVGAFTKQAAELQSTWLADLQLFSLLEVAPVVLPRHERFQLEDIRKILKQSRKFVENIEKIMTGSARQFETALETAGNEVAEAVRQLKGIASQMQTSLGDVGENVRNSAFALAESSGRVKDSAERLATYHHDLRNAYSEMHSHFELIQQNLARHAKDQLDRIGTLNRDFGAAAEKIVSRADGVSQTLLETTGAFHKAGEQLIKTEIQITSLVGSQFRELGDTFGKSLSDHQTEMNRHKREMGQVDQGLQRIATSLEKIEGAVRDLREARPASNHPPTPVATAPTPTWPRPRPEVEGPTRNEPGADQVPPTPVATAPTPTWPRPRPEVEGPTRNEPGADQVLSGEGVQPKSPNIDVRGQRDAWPSLPPNQPPAVGGAEVTARKGEEASGPPVQQPLTDGERLPSGGPPTSIDDRNPKTGGASGPLPQGPDRWVPLSAPPPITGPLPSERGIFSRLKKWFMGT